MNDEGEVKAHDKEIMMQAQQERQRRQEKEGGGNAAIHFRGILLHQVDASRTTHIQRSSGVVFDGNCDDEIFG